MLFGLARGETVGRSGRSFAHFGNKNTRTRTSYGRRSCPVACVEQIQERVIVVAAAQLAVSSLPRHGKRAAASPARTPPPSLARRCALPRRKGTDRSDSLFLYVKVAFREQIYNTVTVTMIMTTIRAR